MHTKRHLLAIVMAAATAMAAKAQDTLEVRQMSLAGPYAVETPIASDTVGTDGKRHDVESTLLGSLPLDAKATTTYSGHLLPSLKDRQSVGVLSFYINNSSYLMGQLKVKGPKHYKLYVDGQETSQLKLSPEHHTVSLRFLAQPSDTDSVSVSLITEGKARQKGHFDVSLSPRHPYGVHDLTDGKRVRQVSLSADGSHVIVSLQTTERGGKSQWEYELRQAKSGRLVRMLDSNATWMPRTLAYIEEEQERNGRTLYRVDPLTGERTKLVAGVPKGRYTMSPTEDFIVVSVEQEGPKEDRDVFQVLEMDDRQPSWRNRDHLVRVDLATGLKQPLTNGIYGEHLLDISNDGRQLLVMSHRSRLEKRPTTVCHVFTIDATTLKADTLLRSAEFIDMAVFSPDATQLLVRGNPEAFDRMGCQLPQSVTPSMTENELFIYDIASKEVKPMTRDFNPSVENVHWATADNKVYFTAEDRDYINMFCLNPKSGAIDKLPLQGDYVYRFSVAGQAAQLAYLSYKTMEPASAYVADFASMRKGRQTLLFDGRTALGDAELGTCQDWNFTNSKGDTVYGRLYLPKDFDPAKKYPMIVYYYGGCSPVSRYFESPYAPQMWNSLGYVAYILQPSGATGFGQEWASRHVNTAGGTPMADGTVPAGTPAGDIIEGTKLICQEHPFIDAAKVGCMGASYGGFMTQYLQTVTDIFAAAVSHAGIANHTSYWGEGYWGYNYSEVSMANSYPWSHRQLYVDQSPLFRADKIHTPLLLLHGNADTNVPLIESLQMFTALKLLGREVALVEVEGENHHILDYRKREKWLATQMAWFQRWLKDDPTWWDALYPKKAL